jgi:hypothetical protein
MSRRGKMTLIFGVDYQRPKLDRSPMAVIMNYVVLRSRAALYDTQHYSFCVVRQSRNGSAY